MDADPSPGPAMATMADASGGKVESQGRTPTAAVSKSRAIFDARDCHSVNLGGLGPRLRAQAKQQQTTVSALVRRAVLLMLGDEPVAGDACVDTQTPDHSPRCVNFSLSLPHARAMALIGRARAAGMSRGEFVWSLLNSQSPPPLPPDHSAALQALRASTDRIAVLSTDLNEFMRLLGRASRPNTELEAYRASIMSLNQDVRQHLKDASVLIGELRPYRRPR